MDKIYKNDCNHPGDTNNPRNIQPLPWEENRLIEKKEIGNEKVHAIKEWYAESKELRERLCRLMLRVLQEDLETNKKQILLKLQQKYPINQEELIPLEYYSAIKLALLYYDISPALVDQEDIFEMTQSLFQFLYPSREMQEKYKSCLVDYRNVPEIIRMEKFISNSMEANKLPSKKFEEKQKYSPIATETSNKALLENFIEYLCNLSSRIKQNIPSPGRYITMLMLKKSDEYPRKQKVGF